MKIMIDFLETYDKDSLISELKRISKQIGKQNITKNDLNKFSRVSYETVLRKFGSLRHALEVAGLKPSRYTKASDDELLHIILDLWERTLEKEGRTPQGKDLKDYGYQVSRDTYTRRFGSWKKALIKACDLATPDIIEYSTPIRKTERKTRKLMSLTRRFFVMKRDSFTCRKCGAHGYGVRLEVDHIVPVAKGGSNALDNLQTLCFDCNRGKRDHLED